MKALHLLAACAATFVLLAPADASAQVLPGGNIAAPLFPQPGSGSLYPTPIPPQGGMRGSRHGFHDGFHRGFRGGDFVFFEEPQVIVEREIVHEIVERPVPAEPPPPPREAYVIGKSYSSLPPGCMKMIEGGVSYYHCSEGWYRLSHGRYVAIEQP